MIRSWYNIDLLCCLSSDDVTGHNRNWGGGDNTEQRTGTAGAGVSVGDISNQHGGGQHVRAAEQLGFLHLSGQTATSRVRGVSSHDDLAEAFGWSRSHQEQTDSQRLVGCPGSRASTACVTSPSAPLSVSAVGTAMKNCCRSTETVTRTFDGPLVSTSVAANVTF